MSQNSFIRSKKICERFLLDAEIYASGWTPKYHYRFAGSCCRGVKRLHAPALMTGMFSSHPFLSDNVWRSTWRKLVTSSPGPFAGASFARRRFPSVQHRFSSFHQLVPQTSSGIGLIFLRITIVASYARNTADIVLPPGWWSQILLPISSSSRIGLIRRRPKQNESAINHSVSSSTVLQ